MDKDKVIYLLNNIFNLRLSYIEDIAYSSVSVNGFNIEFTNFSIFDDVLNFHFEEFCVGDIHLNDIYEIK